MTELSPLIEHLISVLDPDDEAHGTKHASLSRETLQSKFDVKSETELVGIMKRSLMCEHIWVWTDNQDKDIIHAQWVWSGKARQALLHSQRMLNYK